MPPTLKEGQIEFPQVIELALFQNGSTDKGIRRTRCVTTRILLVSGPKSTAAAATCSQLEVAAQILKSTKA